MDLCSLIERNAAFAPNKAAINYESETLSYAAFAARIDQTARALKAELGVGRGDRVAILSLNRPDYLVLLYACARLGAILVPLNWRLAVAEQSFILSDAAAKVLVLEQAFAAVLPALEKSLPRMSVVGLDFTPPRGKDFDTLLRLARSDGRNPHTDLSCPLLIVYTSGTTGVQGRGAAAGSAIVERRDEPAHARPHLRRSRADRAALLSRRRPQHPDHAGAASRATVTIHARFTPDATLATIERERPTLTVLVPATIRPSPIIPAGPPRISPRSRRFRRDRPSCRRTRSNVSSPAVLVLQVYGSTETCPIAVYTRLGGDLSRAGSTGLPGLC